MKQDILNRLRQARKKMDAAILGKKLNLKSNDDYKRLHDTIETLIEDKVVFRDRNGYLYAREHPDVKVGTLDLKSQGYGFLMTEDEHADIYIHRSNTLNALDGDTCAALITERRRGDRYEGELITILERNYDTVIGEYFQGAIFIKNQPDDVVFYVPPKKRSGLTDHTLVKARVVKYGKNKRLECEILEVLGHMDDPGIEIIEVVKRHNLDIDFPEDVKKSLDDIPKVVKKDETEERTDLRDKFIFTIDGADTKDIDDAISIEKTDDGRFLLGVHIADVSHYVTEDSELDKEAYERGTSVYLADRVIPMLPRKLSNGICSLNPQVDRLAISCLMKIDEKGTVHEYDIFPSVIRSYAQMTYDICNDVLGGDEKALEEYKEFKQPLEMMHELSKILHGIRTKIGSINFETIEPKIVFDDSGNVTDLKIKDRGESEKIIEEFMLVANQVIATHFSHKKFPFIYRVHEKPDEERIERLYQFLKHLGVVDDVKEEVSPKTLQRLLDKVEGTTYEKVINTLMIRSMAKARYAPENLGHYGLAFRNYTHFTSPIRRYPDLLVHRMIRSYLFNKRTDMKIRNHYKERLPDYAKQASQTERTAMVCEREVMDMKKAEYMEDHVGETFTGVIASVLKFGMFVELPNTVEGLVHISTFPEAMEYDEKNLTLLGIASRKEYTVGDEVRVKCVKANKLKGRIDFELVREEDD